MSDSEALESPFSKRVILALAWSVFMSLCGAIGFVSAGAKGFQMEADGVELLSNERYLERLFDLFGAAEKKIWVCMYVARYQESRSFAVENKVLKALATAYARGIDVRVIFDRGMEWDAKRGRMSKRLSKKNDEAFEYLFSQGVPVRWDDPEQILHAKSVLVDDEYAIIGSHNWTYSALKKNVETSVLLKMKSEASVLACDFEAMWLSAESSTQKTSSKK